MKWLCLVERGISYDWKYLIELIEREGNKIVTHDWIDLTHGRHDVDVFSRLKEIPCDIVLVEVEGAEKMRVSLESLHELIKKFRDSGKFVIAMDFQGRGIDLGADLNLGRIESAQDFIYLAKELKKQKAPVT